MLINFPATRNDNIGSNLQYDQNKTKKIAWQCSEHKEQKYQISSPSLFVWFLLFIYLDSIYT